MSFLFITSSLIVAEMQLWWLKYCQVLSAEHLTWIWWSCLLNGSCYSFLLTWPFAGLGPEIPEDLYHLIKKAVAVRKHLERNRKDKDSKFRLILIESRVHRLARYYKRTKKLPPNWKYESATASTLVA
jgi:ribosomal protein S15P/S13E